MGALFGAKDLPEQKPDPAFRDSEADKAARRALVQQNSKRRGRKSTLIASPSLGDTSSGAASLIRAG